MISRYCSILFSLGHAFCNYLFLVVAVVFLNAVMALAKRKDRSKRMSKVMWWMLPSRPPLAASGPGGASFYRK